MLKPVDPCRAENFFEALACIGKSFPMPFFHHPDAIDRVGTEGVFIHAQERDRRQKDQGENPVLIELTARSYETTTLAIAADQRRYQPPDLRAGVAPPPTHRGEQPGKKSFRSGHKPAILLEIDNEVGALQVAIRGAIH